jgi:predicted PurR-regulated permease PerM
MIYRNLQKANAFFIFGFAVLATLYFGAGFLIPLTFAAFLAALMKPVNERLEKTGLPNLLASLVSTLLVFVVVGGLFFLFFYQLKIFADDFPKIKEEVGVFLENIQQSLSSVTGLSPEEQKEIISKRSDTLLNSVETQLALALGNFVGASLKFLLVLVYLFLFLLNRRRFVNFLLIYLPDQKEEKARILMHKTSKVAHHYLWGRAKVMGILAAMYIVAFLIFDVRYAILLTVFGAIITIIPYIGPLLSGVLPVCFVIIFGSSFTEVVLFSIVILVIQLIESYVLEPVIIGSEVKLSPLAVIIAVIIGGIVWGIAGMILFVPIFAIIKILADYTHSLRPVGYLLGNSNKL